MTIISEIASGILSSEDNYCLHAAPPSKITPLGRAMASFPVAPRYARMLAMGHQQDLLPYVIAAVAALSVDQLFVEHLAPSDKETEVIRFLFFIVNLHLNTCICICAQ